MKHFRYGLLLFMAVVLVFSVFQITPVRADDNKSSNSGSITALQEQISKLLKMVQELQNQLNQIRNGQVNPVTPTQPEPVRPVLNVSADYLFTGSLTQPQASIYQWGTHQLDGVQVLRLKEKNNKKFNATVMVGKPYLVKAENDSVLAELKRLTGTKVRIWGEVEVENSNLEGGFVGIVAKRVVSADQTIVCPAIPKLLKMGSTGEGIKNVQKFLSRDKMIYPEGLATGYFGPMTKKAIEKFQDRQGLRETGEFDEATKSALENLMQAEGMDYKCIDPTPIPVPNQGFKVYSPQNGESWRVGQTYKIAWNQVWPTLTNQNLVAIKSVKITLHKYFACLYSNPACAIAEPMPYTISENTENDGVFEWTIPADLQSMYQDGQAVITVSAVDGGFSGRSGVFNITSRQVDTQGIRVNLPTSGAKLEAGKTQQIKWESLIAQAAVVTPGVPVSDMSKVSIKLEPYIPCLNPAYPGGPICMMVQPAPYVIAIDTPNDGVFDWTIPADLGSMYRGNVRVVVSILAAENIYGKSGIFMIVNQSTNQPPVISGATAPTVLKVGETGTWTIKASDPENGNLSYSVLWGDEVPQVQTPTFSSIASGVLQSATFTHVYTKVGTFNPKFRVTDNSGLSAETSASVEVSPVILPTSTSTASST
jgi:hypothetical protein